MGFKEFIQHLGQKKREKKELARQIEDRVRIEEMIEQKRLSSNERELNRFLKEDREEEIKEALDVMRKTRRDDIAFGHNPLDVKNITSHTDWEILKERNQFTGKGNMFMGQGASVMRNNPNLLKNNMRLLS